MQSFDFNALKSFSTFSDLPLIYLFFNNEMPSDFTEAIEVIHGVGPSYEILFKEKFLDQTYWVFKDQSPYSEFVENMHELGLSVHAFDLKEDELRYEDKLLTVEESVTDFLNFWSNQEQSNEF